MRLRLSPSLLRTVDNKLDVELNGSTITECLLYGSQHYPELGDLLWTDGTQLNPQLLLFHNNYQVRESDFNNPVQDGDVLDLIPAIEGG